MAEAIPAITATLRWEGGYQDDPSDSGNWTGGAPGSGQLKGTNWGIAAASHPSIDIKNLTQDEAVSIYQMDYWLPIYSQISSQSVANKIFDCAVNMGSDQAHKIAQRACIECGQVVTVDGILGTATLRAINVLTEDDLLSALRGECVTFYHDIVNRHPEKAKFLVGWLNRANA